MQRGRQLPVPPPGALFVRGRQRARSLTHAPPDALPVRMVARRNVSCRHLLRSGAHSLPREAGPDMGRIVRPAVGRLSASSPRPTAGVGPRGDSPDAPALPDKEEVGGSSPPSPTHRKPRYCGVSGFCFRRRPARRPRTPARACWYPLMPNPRPRRERAAARAHHPTSPSPARTRRA